MIVLSASLAACAQMGGGSASKPDASGSTASTSAKVPPGMNANGDVIDPAAVEAGHGKTVKGINDFEGEITGNPVAGSPFPKLQIGMGYGTLSLALRSIADAKAGAESASSEQSQPAGVNLEVIRYGVANRVTVKK